MEAKDNASSPPGHILGYTIRSHTRIFVSYIIPTTFAVCVYIVQFIADCAVSYAHFNNHQARFGGATISLVVIAPFLTFIVVLSSKEQWNNPQHPSRSHFLGYHIIQLVLFPFFTIFRFAYRIFWSIEALFHEDNDKERMFCLEKATECSTCELYLFIQAYAQAAPQIILQMYNMLTQDLFRDYQTTTVQAISLVFSAIDLAAVTTSYQRFESQRQVGRVCPWSSPQELEAQRRILECDARLRNECACKKRESERSLTHFPQSEKIIENFKIRNNDNQTELSTTKTHKPHLHGYDQCDDNDDDDFETTVLIHSAIHTTEQTTALNITDDDKIRSNPKPNIITKPINQNQSQADADEIIILDTIPDSPPPLPPHLRNETNESPLNTSQHKRVSRTFSQLETFKDMLVINAQLYIKDHVPHPPKMLMQRIEAKENKATSSPSSPKSPKSDEVDFFFLPRPTKLVNGIQQEDFAAKSIAFFGWISYIIMRMLALATFSCFYPKAFLILVAVHYIVMLIALCLESRFKGKFNVSLFYIVLAYVFVFVILEFRVKFKRIRLFFIGYFIITMVENVTMTIIWNSKEEFESWWFDFIAESIIYSGILFIATLIVYYFLLKPKDVILIVDENIQTQ